MFELAALRNNLANAHFEARQQRLAESLIEQLDVEKTPFSGLLAFALKEILRLAGEGRFEAAAAIAQLIHNLPTWDTLDGWRENYFYEFEVPGYFETAEHPATIKRVIALIAEGQRMIDGRGKAGG